MDISLPFGKNTQVLTTYSKGQLQNQMQIQLQLIGDALSGFKYEYGLVDAL